MILQQYYTSTNKPIRGSAGFGVRAQSSGIDSNVEQILSSAGAYFHPSDLPDTEIEQMPVSVSFFAIGDGMWGITHSNYVGQDYSKGRYGNYFSHALLCNENDLKSIDWMPISLYGNQFWITAEDTNVPHDLPTLSNLPINKANLLVDVSLFVSQSPERVNILRQLIQSYIDAHTIAEGKRIVICDEYSNNVNWIQALSYALPITLRKVLSFTTYQQYQQFINGGTYLLTCVERNSHFSPSQYQFNYFVFNQIDKQISPDIEPKEAAILLADAIKMGDQQVIRDFNEIFEVFDCKSPADMDVIALIYNMQIKPINSISNDIIQRICNFLLSGNDNTHPIRLEAVYNYTRSAMLSNELEKLKILLPTFYQLSRGHADDIFINECVKFLQLQMETVSGIDTCKLYVIELSSIDVLTRIVKESTTSSDWVGFLQNSNPDESTLRKWMRFLGYVAIESGKRGDNILWRALANWSNQHQSNVYIEMISPILSSEIVSLPLSFIRNLVSFASSSNTNEELMKLVQIHVDLVRIGVKSNDHSCKDDILKLIDMIYSKQDFKNYYQIIIDKLIFSPEAIVYITTQLLKKSSNIEVQCLGVIGRVVDDTLHSLLIKFADNKIEPTMIAYKIIDNVDGSQRLLNLLKLIIEAVGSHPSDSIISLIFAITKKAVLNINRRDEIDILLRSISLGKEYIDSYGYLLFTRYRLAQDLIISNSEYEVLALQTVEKKYFEDQSTPLSRDVKRAYLSYKASLINQLILQNIDWNSILSKYLIIPSMYIDNDNIYPKYISSVYTSIVKKKMLDMGNRFADVFVVTMKDSHHQILCELFAEIIKQTIRRSEERKVIILSMLHKLPGDMASIPGKSFVTVLKTLEKRDIDMIDETMHDTYKSGKILNWWTECYYDATVSVTQRIKDLFSRGN